MNEIIKPDYRGGSIVNLMSSIQKSFGKKPLYPELRILKAQELKGKTVVLVVIDALSYEYLKTRKGFLWEHCKGSITSVFPSSTSPAITTFTTGVAPLQHGITGWWQYYKELGCIVNPLPFWIDAGGKFKDQEKARQTTSPSAMMKIPTFFVTHDFIHKNRPLRNMLPYDTLDQMRKQIIKAVKKPGRKFVYAYHDHYDTLSHEHGKTHKRAAAHLRKIEQMIEKLAKDLKNTNTALIVTADHGHIEVTEKDVLRLDKHPIVQNALVLPWTGEPRAPHCFVRPDKEKEFVKYATTKLAKYCTLYKSTDFVKEGWLGYGKQHPQLYDRIGDYTLLMKAKYIVPYRKTVPGYYIGNHGGTTKEEMLVPLIVIQ